MTPHEAAKLLDLPVDATPEQIETRFNELRAKLEDKIVKAPTPGLKAKYRDSLEEITAAFETLTLAADASALPVLQRQRAEDGGQKTGPKPTGSSDSGLRSQVSGLPAPKPKASSKEFAIVALIALAVLGAGGWWVMKTRTENETKARLAAEAKAEADRQAQLAKEKAEHDAKLAREKAEQDRLAQIAAEKAEKERAEKTFTSLRSRMAELNVAYDALMRAEQSAERELSELKSQERDLAREQKTAPTPELRRLTAQVRAQDRLVSWLRDNLPTHPAKVSRAKADEFLSARALEDAATAVAAYATAIDQLKKEIAGARLDLAVTGTLKLSANLEGATWLLVDSFGVERSGSAPAELDDVALGKGTLTFRRTGWPDQKYTVDLRPGGGTAAGKFPIGSLRVTSEPAGAQVYRDKTVIGTTPLTIEQMPPSQLELRLSQRGFRSQKLSGKVEDGKTLTLEATLQPGHAVDPDFILEALPAELAAISDPKERANLITAVLTVARQLEGIEKSSLRGLMEIHLAACQDIRDPKQRLETLSHPSQIILPSLDFTYSRAWGELAAATVPAISAHAERQQALFLIGPFVIHPDLQIKMASAMTNWFPGTDDWTYRGIVGQRFAEAGAEAEAQRAVASAMDPSNEFQNKVVRDYVVAGRQTRQFLPVKLALLKGDLAAAQRELARYTGKLEYAELIYTAGEFIRWGDADSALRMGRLAQTEYLTAAYTTSALVNAANMVGNYPLAERWAATLTDTTEAPTRSQAYLTIANSYLTQGRTDEAMQAINKVVTFTSTGGDRYQCAVALVQLGEAARARNLVRSSPVAFNKEDSVKLWHAATYFAAIGDSASTERALQVLQSDNPAYFTVTLTLIVQALGQMGRFDEAQGYQSRLGGSAQLAQLHYSSASVTVRRTPADEWGDLIEQTPAGMPRAAVMYSILARNLDRQNSARFAR